MIKSFREVQPMRTTTGFFSVDQVPRDPFSNTLLLPARPLDKPLSENYIRVKMTKKVEKMFNMVWYHLYKIWLDIDKRRTCALTEQIKNERALLLNYTQRAMNLWKIRSNLPEVLATDDDRDTLRSIESDVKGLKLDVEFLDTADINSRTTEILDACQSKTATKYKEMVLEALGLARPPATRLKRPSSPEKRSPVLRPVRGTPAVVHPLACHTTAVVPGVRNRAVTFRKETVKVNTIKSTEAGQLFGDTIMCDETSFAKAEMHTAGKRRRDFARSQTRTEARSEEVSTPLTCHARATGRLTKQQITKVLESDLELKAGMDHVAAHIFGKPKAFSTMSTADGESTRRRRIRVALYEKVSEAELAIRTLDEGALCKKYASEPKPVRRSQRRNQPNNPSATRFSRRTEDSTGYASSRGGTRSKQETRRRTASAMPVGEFTTCDASGLEKLMKDCRTEQRRTTRDLRRVVTAGRKIKRKITRMQGELERGTSLLQRKTMNKYMRFFAEHKHLFIYGKEGQGRFLNATGKDLVKASDLMMRLNPKYGFLTARMKEILIKEPSYM